MKESITNHLIFVILISLPFSFLHSQTLYNDWKFLGPTGMENQVNGLVNAVYVDTINDTTMNRILVGTNTSGIWRTTDGGSHWQNITDSSGLKLIGINDITGDHNNGNVLYAASGSNLLGRNAHFGLGIIKSIDGGTTWNVVYPVGLSQPAPELCAYRVLVDPTNSQRVFALIDTMLIRSLDAGQTWTKIFGIPHYSNSNPNPNDFRYLRDIEMKPGDPDILYIASDHYQPYWHRESQVWKISHATDSNLVNIETVRIDLLFPNDGDKISTERFEIAVSPAEPEAVFVCCSDVVNDILRLKIWKFENGQWGKKIDLPVEQSGYFSGCGYYKLELLVSPTDPSVLYVGGLTFTRVEDWNPTEFTLINGLINSENYHVDTRDAAIIRGSVSGTGGKDDIIIAGNDGGVSKTIDGIRHWTNINGSGLNITQFYGIGSSNVVPYWIGGGTQDNAFYYLNLNNWEISGNSDFGDAYIDNSITGLLYSSIWPTIGYGILIVKSDDFGKNFSLCPTPTAGEFWAVTLPLRINPKKTSTIYVAARNLYISWDRGENWTQRNVDIPWAIYNEYVRCHAMTIASADTNTLYLGYSGFTRNVPNFVLKSSDGGQNWLDISPTDTRYLGITDIEVSPADKDSVWVSFSDFVSIPGLKKVMVSYDGGQNWNDYSAGLPDMPVNCLLYKRVRFKNMKKF